MGQENTVYRPPTGLRKALFFLITGIFTTLLIVAITLGYYGVKAYCFYEETCKNGGWEGDSCVRNDAEVGYVPTENTWSRHRVDPVFTICTDNRGGRVADHHMTAPAKVDALFIGCSFTWGHGVEEPDTYAQHLHCRTGYEVYNAGVASYGTTTALLSIKRYADLRPKLLVYGYIDHHKLRSISPSAFSSCPIVRPVPFVDFDAQDRPYIHPPIGSTKKHDRYLREVLLDHPFGMRDIYWAMYRDYLKLTLPENVQYAANCPEMQAKLLSAAAWGQDRARLQRVMSFLILEMTRQAKAMDAKLLIAHLPTSYDWTPTPPILVEAVAQAQAKVPDTLFLVDTYPALRELADALGMDAVFIPNDFHPTAAAHGCMAKAIEPMFRKLMAP